MAKDKEFIPRPSGFSWAVADITERHGGTTGIGRSIVPRNPDEERCTEVLRKIHELYDPDHKKALARLKKTFA
jgi:hypothetical protein